MLAEIEKLKEQIYEDAETYEECVGFYGSKPMHEEFVELTDEQAEALDLLELAELALKQGRTQDARELIQKAKEVLNEG
jgi:hypothetical protein